MKNKPDSDKPLDTSQPKRVLGKVPMGAFETELEQAPEDTTEIKPGPEPVKGLGGLRRSERKGKASPPAESNESRYGPPTPGTSDDRLVLPEGGLVAMRRSGGLRFTSREVVVYADGHITAEGDAAPGPTRSGQARKLNDEDLAKLYRALDQANFQKLPATSGRQNPDGYAYEIVARIGPASYPVEVFDGSIPRQLAPLIHLLTGYMRPPG